jgi:type IV secretory pathway VirB2 component (pilin)
MIKAKFRDFRSWLGRNRALVTMVAINLMLAAPACAQAQSGSPWENAVNVLMTAFTTTIARGLSLVSIVVGGLTFAFSEGSSKRLLAGILFGVGMAIGAVKSLSRDFKMEDLIQRGTLDGELAALLKEQLSKRSNLPISSGTGVGKSTLLSILASEIPDQDRIVLIEDTAEIHLTKPNLVRFEARQPQPGSPGVTVRELLKATLRHRLDGIILGEIRGGEAFDLLQLLNTGHSGTISTVHANSAQQALARFANCVLQSGIDLPYASINSNIGDSLDLVVQLERRSGIRKVSEVLSVRGYDIERHEFRLERYCCVNIGG